MRSVLKVAVASILLAFLFLMTNVVEAEQQPEMQPEYVVVKPIVSMYLLPSRDSEVGSQVIYGTSVTLLESNSEWGKIRTADQYVGWVQIDSLRKVGGRRYAASGRIVRVAQFSANVYRDQDVTLREPIITVPWETRLEVVSEDSPEDPGNNRWIRVRLPDDREGYIQRGDVSFSFEPVDITASIAIAKKFLGVTYTWGGTTAFGFDCSGFVQMILRQRGIVIPRDAKQQVAWAGFATVERKNLQPGDVLYFGSSPNDVTHTGMYIGGGQFIHDTTHEHPLVQISNLEDAPWTTLLVAARRIKE